MDRQPKQTAINEAQRQKQIRRNQVVIKLLQSWCEDDEQEQRETGKYL